MISAPEAFILLSVPDVSLTGQGLNPATGTLDLECVSVPHPQDKEDRDVYIVLRLGPFEMPIAPSCAVVRIDEPKARVYRFTGTQGDPDEFALTLRGPFVDGNERTEKLATFENILQQYVAEFSSGTGAGVVAVEPLTAGQAGAIQGAVDGNKNLRGHLMMINEDTGEIIGEVEDRFRITEDASMRAKGHENDPVIIHVPDEYTRDSDKHALEVFATVIPPEERNWISSSANMVSHAISMTTNLLIGTISTGASLYVNHTTPSPHHPASGAAIPTGSTISKDGPSGASTSGAPPPVPPRALTFLTSEKTRKNLATVHSFSGQAVKVSTKTVALIDGMIRRAMGAKPKRQKYFPTGITPSSAGPSTLSPNTAHAQGQRAYSRSRSPSPTPSARSGFAPPPYPSGGVEKNGGYPPEKPALPPRQPSPAPPGKSGDQPPVPYDQYKPQGPPPPLPQRKLTTTDHILISADLILSTIDDSARRMLDVGTAQLGKVVNHKYGPQAAESSLYMAGTARNVGLVYIDMSGIGRRALLKRAGKTFLKARLSSNNPTAYPPPPTHPPVVPPRK